MWVRPQYDVGAIFKEEIDQLFLPLVWSVTVFASEMQIKQD